MSGPDRIWVNWKPADDEHPPSVVGAATVYSHINTMAYPVEYIRRDPAVLAALPEVQALIETAQWARNRLERIADDCWHGDGRDLKRSIIGIFADFDAALLACGSIMPDEIRALAPADATAALAARDAAMIARGMREAAGVATSFLVGDPLNGIPLRNPMAHEVADAILARADQIERDAK